MAFTTLLVIGALAAAAPADTPSTTAPAGLDAAPSGPAGFHADPWSSLEVVAPTRNEAGSGELVRRPKADGGLLGELQQKRTPSPWLRTILSLGGVVALILLLAWGYRVGTGAGGRLGLGRIPNRGDVIQVLCRTNLSPRQALHLVRIGSRLVLVGATSDALRALAVIEDAELAARLAGRTAQRDPESHVAAFRRCLEAEAREYEDNELPGGESGTRRAQILAEQLARTARRLQAIAPTGSSGSA